MKRTISLLLAVVLSVFALAACGGEKEEKIEIPEGYTVYENDALSFAYPEDWTKTEGSMTTLTGENGNNITVVFEDKTDTYEKWTTEDYKTDMIPVYEAMGFTIKNPAVEQTETNGLKITKVSHTATVSGKTMEQTQYIATIGDNTYTVTVTEVESDDALVQNVFDTLCRVK